MVSVFPLACTHGSSPLEAAVPGILPADGKAGVYQGLGGEQK